MTGTASTLPKQAHNKKRHGTPEYGLVFWAFHNWLRSVPVFQYGPQRPQKEWYNGWMLASLQLELGATIGTTVKSIIAISVLSMHLH